MGGQVEGGRVFQAAAGKMVTKPLYVAAKLGIADQLTEGPKHIDELAAAVGAHPHSLYELMRTLASLGMFAEVGERRFRLTPTAEILKSGPRMRSLVSWLNDPRHDHAWQDLEQSLRSREKPLFEWLPTLPELADLFNDAISGHANLHAAVVDAYPFTGIHSLVDVGGGRGTLLARIRERHPRIRGTVFDLPEVVPGAREMVGPEVTLVGGDFFREALPRADAHLLSFVLHDWDDERARQLLARCHAATHKLLIIEIVAYTGGIGRTEGEYRLLLAGSGFHVERIVATTTPCSVIEAVRV